MAYWIFKLIYYPIFAIILLMTSTIALMMFKDVGWEQPYRWMVLVGALAYMADYFVNKH